MCVSLLIVISLILFNFMQESRLVVVYMTFYISFGTFCFMNIHITLFPTMQSVQYSPHTTEAESVRLSGVQCEGQGTDYYAHLKHWVAGDEDYLFSWFHHWRGVSFILKRMWHYIKAKFVTFKLIVTCLVLSLVTFPYLALNYAAIASLMYIECL